MQRILGQDSEALADASVLDQVTALEQAVLCNPVLARLLEVVPALGMPHWYLGAGAVTQTVWNLLHGFGPGEGIKDYDIVYFDPGELTGKGERELERRAMSLLGHAGVDLDVTNEARVHLWYRERFGVDIRPYRSSEHAISTWPTTASSVGVRYQSNRFVVCAPWGLRDLFGLMVRPNPDCPDRSAHQQKFARWSARWPALRLTSSTW
jgi:hypothetical protein